MSDVSAQFELSMGFYSDFQIVHTKSAIKVQSFGVNACPRANPLDENRGLENTCAPNPKENTILSQKAFKSALSEGSRMEPRET